MEELSFEDLDRYLLAHSGKIIHQIWFGIIPNKTAARKAFEGLRKYRDSWLLHNPDMVYMCWNLQRCYDLVRYHYPQHIEMYRKYPYHIQRCDAVRYFILHRYGGLYADMDYACNSPWSVVMDEYPGDIYLVETPNKAFSDDIHISNSLMFSKPGHIFWSKLFIELEMNQTMPIYYSRHMTIMFTTGPSILNRVYSRYRNKYKLGYYPYKGFHPFGLLTDIKTLGNKAGVYAMHLGKGSWESNDSKWIIFAYQEWKVLTFIVLILLIPIIIMSKIKIK